VGRRTNDGSRQGRKDSGKIGYGGPCPLPGKPHRYFFKLYALDAKLNLMPGAKKKVELAMQGYILAQGEYIGRFSRLQSSTPDKRVGS
jgi:Raf kinase inhibitor-like YbhB/YbcL family protein